MRAVAPASISTAEITLTRAESLLALANVLKQAAQKARGLAKNKRNGTSREAALATQIDGIAMEFEILAGEDEASVYDEP